MSEIFAISGENGDITSGPAPQLQGMFIPGVDDSHFVDGFGVVTPWGGSSTARRYGDYGISADRETQLVDLSRGLISAGGVYDFEGIVGPQGIQGIPGRDGLPGIITVIGLNLPQSSNYLTDLPHNIDQINDLGTAANKLIYTSSYDLTGGPVGGDLILGTTDGDTLATYGSWTEREISFDTADALQSSFELSDGTGASIYRTTWGMQSWTTVSAYNITKVALYCYKYGSPGDITVSIRATDVDGKPTGVDLCSVTVADSVISGFPTRAWYIFTFDTPYTLEIDTKYAIVFRAPGGDGSNYFAPFGYGSSGYADGDYATSTNSGSLWGSLSTTNDMDFKIYGTGIGVAITSGKKYTIIVRATNVAGAARLYWSLRDDDPYDTGDRYHFESSNSGSSWDGNILEDVWFKIKADEVEKESGSFFEDDNNSVASLNGANWGAQSFTATSSYTLSSVILKLSKYLDGGSIGTVTVSIREATSVFYSEATWAEAALTSTGRALLDDTTTAAQRTTIGAGTGDSPTFTGLTLSGITAEATDVDKFLVDSMGIIKYRTGAQVLSDIGGQPLDTGLTNLAALTYASDSFIKVTATDVYAIRTIAETKTDLGLNNVSNVAIDDTAYNATSWNTNTDGATKNAIRDKVETMNTAIGLNTTHRGLSSGNPHSVTPTDLSLVIGTNTQAWDAGLDSLAGLGYVSDSMIKITAEDTYAIRTMAQVLSDIGAAASGHNHDATYQPLNAALTDIADVGVVGADSEFLVGTGAGTLAWENAATAKASIGLGNVENTKLSTWAGTANITTLGTIATIGNITIAENGTIGQAAGPLVTFNDAGNDLKISNCAVSIAGVGVAPFVPSSILHLKESNPNLTFEGTHTGNTPKFVSKSARQTPNNFFVIEYWGKNSAAAQVLYGSLLLGSAEAAGNEHGYVNFYLKNGAGGTSQVMKIFGEGKIGVNDITPNSNFDVTGDINTTVNYKVDDTQVVSNQGAAVANATDATTTMARLNDLLARCRTHGLIAT